MTNVLDKFIQDMKTNVPGFIAVSVTEVRSGVSYGSESVILVSTLTWLLLITSKL